jgi:hypothetical protein
MADYINEKDRLKVKIKALLLARDFSKEDAIDLAADVFAAAQLRDSLDLELQVSMIQLFRDVAENPLEALEAVRKSNATLNIHADDVDIFKLAVCGVEALLLDVKNDRSTAGKKGGIQKNAPYAALKKWALQEAKKMHKGDKQIAKVLSNMLPAHLKDVSDDPQRLIYDALRAKRKPGSDTAG